MITQAQRPIARDGMQVDEVGGFCRVGVIIKGVTPLLQNAMSMDCLLGIRDKAKKPKTAEKPSLRDEADNKVHRLANGDPCVPIQMLYSSFINAGQFVRLDGKRQVSTAKATVLPGMLTIEEAHLPIFLPGADDPAPWEVDIQQGRNPNGGEAVCIVRPRFDHWELRLTVSIDREQMPLPMARNLIDIAGSRIGIGDFRPQRKGTFGRFSVNAWEEAING